MAPGDARESRVSRALPPSLAAPGSLALPNSEECERAVLGAVLLDSSLLNELTLTVGDFYSERHQIIYHAYCELAADGQPADIRTVQAKLEGRGELDRAGGLAYLAGLDLDLPDIGRVRDYARIVKDRSLRRELIQMAEGLIRECSDGPDRLRSASALLETHASTLERLRLASLPRDEEPLATPLGELLAQDLPPRRWIAEGLIQDRDVVMVHSWRGVGKTLFIYGLAYAVSSGTPFLRHHVSKPAPVLVCDGEMPREDIQRRFAAIVEAAEIKSQAPLLILSSDMLAVGQWLPSLTTPEGQRIVERNLARLGDAPRVLILDSLSTLCHSETPENDAASWDEMQAWLLKLRRQGVTILFCHHDSKASSQRGTSKREDILSQVVQLLRPKDYTPDQGARFEVHFTKARGVHGADAAPYEAWLAADAQGRQQWTVRELGAIKVGQARELAQAGLSVRDIAKELGVGKSTAQRWLAKAKG